MARHLPRCAWCGREVLRAGEAVSVTAPELGGPSMTWHAGLDDWACWWLDPQARAWDHHQLPTDELLGVVRERGEDRIDANLVWWRQRREAS